MEKNMKKNMYYMHVYVCAYLNHTAIHQQLTQHCKSTMLQLKKKSMANYLINLSNHA